MSKRLAARKSRNSPPAGSEPAKLPQPLRSVDADHADPFHCVKCGSRTQVYRTAPPFRWRKCPACKHTYRTQEVMQEHADSFMLFLGKMMEYADAFGVAVPNR